MSAHSHQRRSPCCSEEAWRYMLSGEGGGYTYSTTPEKPPQWAQDALDGAALRRLREATTMMWVWCPEEDSTGWQVAGLHPLTNKRISGRGDSFAEAADKCREALL